MAAPRTRLIALCLVLLVCGAEAADVANNLAAFGIARDSVDKFMEHMKPEDTSNAAQNVLYMSSSPTVIALLEKFESVDHPLVHTIPAVLAHFPEAATALAKTKLASKVVEAVRAVDDQLPAKEPSAHLANGKIFTSIREGIEEHKDKWMDAAHSIISDAGEEGVGFIELVGDGSDNSVQLTSTFVDSLFGAQDIAAASASLRRANFALMGLLFLAVVVVVAALFGVLLGNFLSQSASQSLGVAGYAFWIAWTIVAFFITFSALTLMAANSVVERVFETMLRYSHKTAAESLLDDAAKSITGTEANLQTSKSVMERISSVAMQIGTSVASSVGSHLGSTISSVLQSQLGDLEHLQFSDFPVICKAAWTTLPEAMSANKYPLGSPIYEYNLRRILDATDAGESLETDRVRTLLMDPAYPPLSGGITNTQAQLFGGISNECVEKHGDLDLCCSEDECRADHGDDALGIKKCLMRRCPGKILHLEGGSNHCNCIEVMTKMSLPVEHRQMALCTGHVRNIIRDELQSMFDSDLSASNMRAGITKMLGCDGVYDGVTATIFGPLEKKSYMDDSTISDSAQYPDSSYISPTTGDASTARISWSLAGCSRLGTQTHVVQIRYSNGDAEKHWNVMLDGKFVKQLTIPVGVGPDTFANDLTFSIPDVTMGDHTLTLQGTSDSNGLNRIHRIAVCQEDKVLTSGKCIADL